MRNKLTTHGNIRYFDRSDQDITRKKIITHINNGGEIIYAKRLSSSKSLAYIPIKGEIFKVVINRKTKVIVSILPLRRDYEYSIDLLSETYNNKNYHIKLFPDCYYETQNTRALTKIYELDDNQETVAEINYIHPFFEGLFRNAWEIYTKRKGLNEIKTETETSKIEIEEKRNCS
jgi:hypothetical protein